MQQLKFRLWILVLLPILIFLGCGSSSNSKSTEMRKIDISVSISDAINQKLSKIMQKRDTTIARVTLDVNSSSHIYMQDEPFTKPTRRGENWTITTTPLPIGERLTFRAKAYNASGKMVFSGEYSGAITTQTINISLPLSSVDVETEETPSLRSIVFNNHEMTDITFNIYNPNGDDLDYQIISVAGSTAGSFDPDYGTLDFSTTLKYISLDSTFTPPSVVGTYNYSFVLINSDGEKFVTNFTLTISAEHIITVQLNKPPVINSIDAVNQNSELTLTVKATNSTNGTLTYLKGTLTYLWEKIDGSATISGDNNNTILHLANYQPNSPVTLKITVTNEGGSSVSQIFKSNGATEIRTLELKALSELNNNLYAINGDGKVVQLGSETARNGYLYKPVIMDGIAYFSFGGELWKSDGTEAGTVMVKDINPNGDANPRELVNINGILYFDADDGVHGRELWRSDGTEAGTVMVKDINPYDLVNINGVFCFNANDGVHGAELWRSDGTEAGTVMVKDINPNGHGYPANLVNINGVLYFNADDGVHGYELWRSDGTEAGTVMVKDITPNGNTFFKLFTFININGVLYFLVRDGSGWKLWRSNGTEEGTVKVLP